MTGTVSRHHRQALKSRIEFGNEHSLGKRLTLMGKTLTEGTRTLIAADRKRFLRNVVDTRTYLTHYTSDGKKTTMSVSAAEAAPVREGMGGGHLPIEQSGSVASPHKAGI